MMDGLEIRLHPTLDILCREDGATVRAFGVRARDDKKAWPAAYKQAVKKARAEGVQWVVPMFRKSG